LIPPEVDETAGYWARTRFFEHAAELYDIIGKVPRARGTLPMMS